MSIFIGYEYNRIIVIPHVRSPYHGSPFIHTTTGEVGDFIAILQMKKLTEM